MSDALQDAGSPYGFIRRGSVFSLVLVPGRKRLYNHAEVAEQDTTLFATLHQALLERGFLIAPTVEEPGFIRSEEHTSELQSLMRISYAVFCLKKKKNKMIYTTKHRRIQRYTTRHTQLKPIKT